MLPLPRGWLVEKLSRGVQHDLTALLSTQLHAASARAAVLSQESVHSGGCGRERL